MKFLQICLFVLATGFVFSSCQKDLSFESGTAQGVLTDDGSGDCLPVTINGNYKVDTTLNATNSLDVQVIFSQEGSYDIRTDTVNGYSFRAVGTVGAAGAATIHMVGSGKPLALGTGVDIFHINYGLSACQVSVVVTVGTSTPAVYTFGATGGVCTGATTAGTYTSGIAMDPLTNTVTVGVTVTTAGNYSITTAAVNGVVFSGTGVFTTGTTSVTLSANGTPPVSATPVNSTYTVADAAGTITGCTFAVTYAATPASAPYTIDCTGATVAGTYQIGTAMNSGNTVTIHATSTGAGFYSVTATAGGVMFTGSGIFPGPVTNQAIVLTATGMPSGTAGTVSFPAVATTSTGNSTCTFNVTYAAAPIVNCSIDGGASRTFNFNASADSSNIPPYELYITGNAASTGPERLAFDLVTNGVYFTNGASYTVNQISIPVGLTVDYYDATGVHYTIYTQATPQTPGFTLTITTITPTHVTGTYNGTVSIATGATHTLTGNFDLPLQ